jgi:hypothetical protein
MKWEKLDRGHSWWLRTDEGRSKGYVVETPYGFVPALMFSQKRMECPLPKTLQEAQEVVCVWVAEEKLEGV